MAKSTAYHVVPRAGGWAAVAVGNARASARARTQAQAYNAARRLSASNGGGEVRIHGRDGRIRDSNTIAPARDPRSSKG